MGEFELVIVGGGLAGLCAAVEAGEQGADVLLLEKEEDIGGSSVLSGRYMAFAGTNMQQDQGMEDSSSTLVEDMLEVGGRVNDEKLVAAYGELQLDTYNWLVDHGIHFLSIQAVSGHSVPRGHTIDSHQAIQALYGHAAALPNVTIAVNSPVSRLGRGETGQVDQVYYEQVGKPQAAYADKGVVLTSGGFSHSKELLGHFAPHLKRTIRIGGPGNKGEGIKMAWEHGAWMRDIPYLSGTYGFHPTAEGPEKSQALAFYKGAIILNQKGKRFVNESLSYKLLGNAALREEEDSTYQIWDQTVMDQSVPGDKLYDFDKLLKKGLIKKADNLQELAALIGISPEALQLTVTEYNEGIEKGEDAFGRNTLTHHFGEPTQIRTAPFYAFETKVAMLATYAGLSVNPRAEVLNPYGEPVPGLFAAGEIAGGFHGAGYMTGSSLGKAAIFGRVAVKSALGKTLTKQ
ncbi:FAD-dependent oxidoreductase [Virgibacillus xinjiangensis]|uniref:FAD-dependent oxidoreductase n=1 Tax=Virgibacillus xinjiangensis TaxID=393090 RepID=A0ABV7CZ65_9BACI